ncbi:hypothetical protein ACFQ1I_21810 [Kitasatospora arboriphila]
MCRSPRPARPGRTARPAAARCSSSPRSCSTTSASTPAPGPRTAAPCSRCSCARTTPAAARSGTPAPSGNLALLLPVGGSGPLPLPPLPDDHDEDDGDPRQLGAVRAVAYRPDPGGDYEAARLGRPDEALLGQLGGGPAWLQYDQTPDCPSCDRAMAMVVQLEEGPDHLTAMNFGSGSAYAFACEPCGSAAFLWQC